ncbi:MAG: M48 family metallopeptidase [Lachnospiraceae bacterium]|nr:M48 family metallopeptidase [Lachnospiraceae bacterium]
MGKKTSGIELKLDNSVFNVTVIQEKRKTVTLKIVSGTNLLVKAPFTFSINRLTELLEKKKKWILEHASLFNGEEIPFLPDRYMDGSRVYYMGKTYEFYVKYKETERVGKKEADIQRIDGKIIVETIDTSEEYVKNQMQTWYKKQAGIEIINMIQKYQPYIGEKIGTIRIKSQKSRWGSCSELGNLNFNWHLILLPESLMEYVIVHELCHLKYLNHSGEFWNCVKQILPDYQERETELKKYGGLLYH